jgi:hypothetical protein
MSVWLRELAAFNEKNIFKWAELPPGRKALPSCWDFKMKRRQTGEVDNYESRVLAKGFYQKEGVDYTEVFALGSNLVMLRMLVSVAVQHDLDVHQLVVKTSFLNGDRHEEVYLTPAPGVKCPQGQVWRLLKPPYGLKQAAKAWHEKLKSSLSKVGFRISLADPCLYIATCDGKRVYLRVHVDDVLIVGHVTDVVLVEKEFSKLHDVRDLGDANVSLGLQIVRDSTQGALWLGESKHIEDLLQTYNMQNSASRVSPLDANQQFIADGDVLAESVPYSCAVGSLL